MEEKVNVINEIVNEKENVIDFKCSFEFTELIETNALELQLFMNVFKIPIEVVEDIPTYTFKDIKIQEILKINLKELVNIYKTIKLTKLYASKLRELYEIINE